MHLLIYVPAWTNYQAGIRQVEALLSQQKRLNQLGEIIRLEFIFSVNAIPEVAKSVVDRITALGAKYRFFNSNLGDVNINLGFLDAAESEADLFWIVSPGDSVSDNALESICEYFRESETYDFIVADEEDRGIRSVTLNINNLDFYTLSEASFGMITGVIYRLATFHSYLHLGVQASFTGWGQLAVLLGGARKECGVVGRILPSWYFYSRGDSKLLTDSEKMENLRHYAHSFFGYVILLTLLFPFPKVQVRRWVYKNWFRLGAYAKAYENEKYGYIRLTDLRHLAKITVAETDIITRLVFFIASRIDFIGIRARFFSGG